MKYRTRSSRADEIKDRNDSRDRVDFAPGVMALLVGGDIELFVTRGHPEYPVK